MLDSTAVTFFYPYPEELEAIDRMDLSAPEFWSHEGKERRRAWVLQTYLRLRRAGYDVAISDKLPTKGTVVLLPEPDIQDRFLDQYGRPHQSLFILTIRADIFGFRSTLGDADVVQNGRFADEKRTFFVPHWPQPGLLPRDPARGSRIKNIVFKGGYGSLKEDYRSETWNAYLRRRDLRFSIASAATEGAIPNWHDYRTADLNLAVRPSFDDGGLRCEKPASKLVNAWHAGVPSLLGKEYAFRELRHSALDFIEVETLDDTMAAIDRLLEDPDLYRRMVEHGTARAKAFTPARITERWAEVLFDRVPQIAATRSFRLSRRVPLQVRRATSLFAFPSSAFEFRKRAGHVARQLSSHFRQ